MATSFVLSDGRSVNNHGFRIDLQGVNLDRFKANPVMLYQHDIERIIGRWDNIRVEDNRLMADAIFDMEDAQGKEVSRKVEAGFLKGCSLGIIVEDMQEVDGVWVATRSEVFEASIVSVPADAGAVRLYDKNHQVLTAEALHLQFQTNNHQNKDMDEKVKELEAQLAAKTKEVTDLTAKVENLKGQVQTLQQEKVTTLLDAAISAGKITEAEKEQLTSLAAKDFEAVQKLIAAKKAPEAPHKSLAATLQHTAGAAAAPAGNERANWTYLDWAKKDPQGLAKLRAENPEEFQRLAGA